ncbi:hypothetical protein IFM89_008299 [Coptis chinensis]|uniref:RNase H type-1 domain-containing protein n=1 Tax=Coptis chinensis TaxID=261450 RepID=A0A835IBS5_9MAGN|nr:hypothetical protein IFM89_008299 [Coptis chinensis]
MKRFRAIVSHIISNGRWVAPVMLKDLMAVADREEDLQHVIWECSFARQLWDWLAEMFNFRTQLAPKFPKVPRIKDYKWNPPDDDIIKVNTYGASHGNPGSARYGLVYRNSNSEVLFVVCKNIGTATNYVAEVMGIIESIEMAIDNGWHKLWIESDSKAGVIVFGTSELPWEVRPH